MQRPNEPKGEPLDDATSPSKWNKTWGDRLSVESQKAKRQNDPRYLAALMEDQLAAVIDADEAAYRSAIVKSFRLGAKHLCARLIWTRILTLRGIDTCPILEQAEVLGMAPQHVKNYCKGDLSFPNFVAFLTDLGCDLSSFNQSLPPVLDRAVAGYQLAVARICRKVKWLEEAEAVLTAHDLFTVLEVLADAVFVQRSRHRGLTAQDWQDIATHLSPDAGTTAIAARASQLESLHAQWADAVVEVRDAIPHRWLKEMNS